MAQTVLGVFNDKENVREAINELKTKNYNPKDISVVMQDQDEAEEIKDYTGSKVSEGAVSGAATGGVLGAITGFIVGAGILPGLGALFIGGPIAAALGITGLAATTISGTTTGVIAGGLIGALVNLGVPEERANQYQENIKAGKILVIVPARMGEEVRVQNVLENHGAEDVVLTRGNASDFDYEDDYDMDENYPYQSVGAKGGRTKDED